MEPLHEVHDSWFELNPEDDFNLIPASEDDYNGASSGGVCGPSNAMTQVTLAGSLVSLFLFICPITLLEYIAERTKAYAYDDWVVIDDHMDCDGRPTKCRIIGPMFTSIVESLPEESQHHWKLATGEIDMGITLINYALEHKWTDLNRL